MNGCFGETLLPIPDEGASSGFPDTGVAADDPNCVLV
jgi:hypothetical protein